MRNPNAIECIELLIPLCNSVLDRIARYNMTSESLQENDDHLDLILMPIFQIGEIVGSGNNLSALQDLYPSDIWYQAYGLRNRIAHGYAKLNHDVQT